MCLKVVYFLYFYFLFLDNWGGICSEMILKDGHNFSHNTGLITLQNYGNYLSPTQVHLTFAHELGHSLGAPVSLMAFTD